MANLELLAILKEGPEAWQSWRLRQYQANPRPHPRAIEVYLPDLRGADLRGAHLSGIDLRGADLRDADLGNADLHQADLHGARLNNANLQDANVDDATLTGVSAEQADFSNAKLCGADLSGANLTRSNFYKADLTGANLSKTNLSHSDLTFTNLRGVSLQGAHLILSTFHWTDLKGTDFVDARMLGTTFTEVDLRDARRLESVIHDGPSSIGIDTIYESKGHIPKAFLRGCGVPDTFITHMESLLDQPNDYFSCFISFSFGDQAFADRLHARLEQEGLRVWYAPESMRGGGKVHEQIERAIGEYDRLLLVLSEKSLASEWVMTEIRNARALERKTGQQKLFPIRLVSFETLGAWKCFDADSGKDLGVEVREYFIPDFSRWEDELTFERTFQRLLRDLRDSEKPEAT